MTPIVSIPEREAQVAILREYLSTVADGEELSWVRIEDDTSIKMDTIGRSMVRRALSKMKRPYEALRGTGVRLSSADSALPIMKGRFGRIDNAVRRADRTRNHLADRHTEQMNARDRDKMTTLAGFFGAVRAFAAEASTKLLKKD